MSSPGEGTFYYDFGVEVSLVATPESGYRFVSWGGGGAPIGDVTSAVTTITSVQADYQVKATFELTGPVQYTLTISSTAGGSVTTPGEGDFSSEEGTVVDLVASPDSGYRFVEWTGNVGTIAKVDAATTKITMNGDYSITAEFEAIPVDQYSLTVSSTVGGLVTTPGEDTFYYDPGTEVDLVATPSTGYQFDQWTGDTVTVTNINLPSTTIIMNGNYSIVADFSAEGEEEGVHFPDANLRAAIRAATGISEGPIYASDLAGLTSLFASEMNIINLAGLQHCTNLVNLDLGYNQISDISPLASLASLERLFLGSNQISNISYLAGLTKLRQLGLWENQIINISALQNLTALKMLWLGDNQISDVSSLAQNTGLDEGDYVDLQLNPLSSASINTYIPQLQDRGVTVDY